MPCPKCGNPLQHSGCRHCGPLPKTQKVQEPWNAILRQQEMQFEEIVFLKKNTLRLKVIGREILKGVEVLVCRSPFEETLKLTESQVVRL